MAPILSGSMEPLVGNVVATSVRLFGGSLIAAGVATFLAASLVLWLLSAIGACVSYGGFRACRRDNRIEVEHGLLQHRFQGATRPRAVGDGEAELIAVCLATASCRWARSMRRLKTPTTSRKASASKGS